MVTVKAGIFPIDIKGLNGPTIGAIGEADRLVLVCTALMAQSCAVAGNGEHRVAAWPSVRAGD